MRDRRRSKTTVTQRVRHRKTLARPRSLGLMPSTPRKSRVWSNVMRIMTVPFEEADIVGGLAQLAGALERKGAKRARGG